MEITHHYNDDGTYKYGVSVSENTATPLRSAFKSHKSYKSNVFWFDEKCKDIYYNIVVLDIFNIDASIFDESKNLIGFRNANIITTHITLAFGENHRLVRSFNSFVEDGLVREGFAENEYTDPNINLLLEEPNIDLKIRVYKNNILSGDIAPYSSFVSFLSHNFCYLLERVNTVYGEKHDLDKAREIAKNMAEIEKTMPTRVKLDKNPTIGPIDPKDIN